MLPHFHAVAWSDDPGFNPEYAGSRMRASARLVSRIAAQTADVSYAIDTSPTNLAAYVSKAPSVGKFREPDRLSPSGFCLSPSALAPVSAVRLLEILSGMYFDELMLSGGNGTYLRTELRRHMIDCATVIGRIVTVEQSTRQWNRVRARTGRDRFHYPLEIVRQPTQLPIDSPISLECPRLLERRFRSPPEPHLTAV